MVLAIISNDASRLTDIVAQLNKWSSNFIAEMLVKKLGAEVYGAPGSFAKGLAAARDLAGLDHRVVAVIGDGAMTGGLAYEAMNNAGHLKKRLIVADGP